MEDAMIRKRWIVATVAAAGKADQSFLGSR